MVKKILKWIAVGLGVVVIVVVAAVSVLYFRGRSRFSQAYAVQVENVAIPTDAQSLQWGQHLAGMLCSGCHGADMAGTDFFNDPALGAIHALNLTSGKGGIGASYSDADFVRTLRHGVRPNGTSVFVMPSKDFYYLSDQDLGSIIAYLRTAPPVDQAWDPKRLTLMGSVLVGLGVFDDSMMADQIDHTGPRPVAPTSGVTEDYGAYLVRLNGCRQCHGQKLSGGKVDDPTIKLLGPNLTPGGDLAGWSETDFVQTMRTGITPTGRPLSEVMPWKTYGGQMSDDELRAIYLYLHSLPKLTTTTQ